jgi:HD-like signal output (HDOD) protein
MNVINSAATAQLSPFENAVDQLQIHASAPVVVQRLLRLLYNPDASWKDVEDVLAVDGALVTRVLRIASSPAFLARPVRELRVAVQTLGCDQLRRVAVAAHFAGKGTPFARNLWKYSLRVAFTAEKLARGINVAAGPDPFLCGLLHDVGTMALEHIIGVDYAKMGFAAGDDAQLAKERDAFGFDHADLGAMVAARWNLFPELELVAQLHHDPDACELLGVPAPTRKVIDLVALARILGRPAGHPSAPTRDAICARLGVEPAVAEAWGGAGARLAAELTGSL